MEVVADYQDLCGECPVWDPATATLYWTDCVGQRFYRYRPNTGRHEILKQGLEINGFRLNEPGGFILTNNSGIWLWDGEKSLQLIADHVGNNKCQMNDCVADLEGRLFSGSCFYDPHGDYPLGKLMRVDNDGRVTVLDDGFHLANGLAFSLDDRTLYFTDSAARRIYSYDYSSQTGEVRNRRLLVQLSPDEGLPDGLAIDEEGFLWSAQWYGGCVVRYDPDGKAERRIATPAKQTSCVTFGGRDFADLYITSAARSEPMPVMPPGYDADSGFFGGPLYRIAAGVRGRPARKTRISPAS